MLMSPLANALTVESGSYSDKITLDWCKKQFATQITIPTYMNFQ